MLTNKQKKCLEIMVLGAFTQKEISEQIDVAARTISVWKKNPEFVAELDRLIKLNIQSFAPKAFKKMTELMDSESPSVRYQATKDVLDRAGYKATDKVELSGALNNPFAELTTEELKKLAGSG
jgi:Bacterial regulatory proteins, luxR family.